MSANRANGLPITNADKRRRVEAALADPAFSGWSNRRVADLCGVHHDTVDTIRPRVEVADSATSGTDKRLGRDGKLRPAAQPRRPRPEPQSDLDRETAASAPPREPLHGQAALPIDDGGTPRRTPIGGGRVDTLNPLVTFKGGKSASRVGPSMPDHQAFDWHADKARANARKHGVTFQQAAEALADDRPALFHVDRADDDHSSREDRWITIASHPARREFVLCIIWTERFHEGERKTRIISAPRHARREGVL